MTAAYDTILEIIAMIQSAPPICGLPGTHSPDYELGWCDGRDAMRQQILDAIRDSML